MKWYYKILGEHTHVKCYMNGALLGTLIFKNDEFVHIVDRVHHGLPVVDAFEEES